MKKIIIILSMTTLLFCCSKEDKVTYSKITYRFHNTRVPYDVQYYSTTEVKQSISTHDFEVTVDFDKKYYTNNTSGVWGIKGDTITVEISSECKTAKQRLALVASKLVGFNYNALK